MGAKTILISSITLVAIAIIIVLLFFISESSFQSPTNLEECKTAAFNGENKVNLVFFATKENTQKYSNFFLQTSPFNKNKDSFNFYYIDSYEPECEIYQEQAILCKEKEITQKAASCPHDFIVVVKDLDDSSLRSSAYKNIISLNSKHQSSVLTHEFGHVFANLADEYIPAIIPKGSKNCASSCDNFPENIDGCFQGCSKDNYYRSIDKGVMRTLSTNNYGALNENIISEKIPKQNTLTGQATSDLNTECSEQEYYLIKGFVKNSKIEIQQQTIEKGCAPSITSGDYIYKITGEKTLEGNFNPKLIFTDAQKLNEQEIQGAVFEYEGEFYLSIPKVNKADTIEILDNNQQQIQQVNFEELSSFPCKI